MTAEVFKDKLSPLHLRVVSSGQEALELLSKTSFDLLVADFDLEDCDGITLLEQVSQEQSLPLILTAFPEDRPSTLLGKTPFKEPPLWLKKPLCAHKLAAAIHSIFFQSLQSSRALAKPLIAWIQGPEKALCKTQGYITHMGLEGATFQSRAPASLSKGESVTLNLYKETGQKKGNPWLRIRGEISESQTKKGMGIRFAELKKEEKRALEEAILKTKAPA